MDRPPLLLLVLVACVVLAGCGGAGQTTTSPATDTTTGDGTDTPAAMPPGVSGGELTDPQALLDAHASALAETGFQSRLSLNATIRQRLGGEDEPLQNVRVRRRQSTATAAGGTPYRYQSANLNTGAQFDVWANESTQLTQVRLGETTQYQRGEPLTPAQLTGASFIERFLTTSTFSVTDTETRDGTTFVTLTATATSDPERALTGRLDEVTDFEATLVVDAAGRIHRVSVDATYRIGGEEASYDYRWELKQLGNVEPAPPEWLSSL